VAEEMLTEAEETVRIFEAANEAIAGDDWEALGRARAELFALMLRSRGRDTRAKRSAGKQIAAARQDSTDRAHGPKRRL
jgi:hypothetical protein